MRVTRIILAAVLAAALSAAPAAAHPLGEDGPLLRLFGQPDLTQDVPDPPTPEQPTDDFGFEDDFGRGADDTKAAAGFEVPPATPQGECGPGSDPEPGLQGRVPPDDPGRDDGYRCNTELVGHYDGDGVQAAGTAGGFKALRYVDDAGHECAFYDSTLLFPTNALNLSTDGTGVTVLDMSDPANPVGTATLKTPAMLTPHESLLLNERRGLLAAVTGNLAFLPSVIDIYDVSEDCRKPVLQSTRQMGRFGHESGFAPDGNTFYATSISTGDVAAVDVTDPTQPEVVWEGKFNSHGLTVSDDGNRAYIAASEGLIILDTSEIQARKANPEARVISTLTWPTMTIPQVAHPVTIDGKPYLVEIDEFSEDEGGGINADGVKVGAGRIIDISDETDPKVVSDIRLEVNQPEHRDEIADDPGTTSPAQGYAGHYCNIPRREEPGILACSFIASGLRIFDIRDPEKPKEIAYYVAPPSTNGSPADAEGSNYAMSSPDFAPERQEVWYTDGGTAFYAVRLTSGVWPRGGGGDDDDGEDEGEDGEEQQAPAPPAATPPATATAPSITLPSARTCVSRRSFPLNVRGVTSGDVRSLQVFVDGERRAVRRGKGLEVPVDLRGLPAGTIEVRVVVRSKAGKRIVDTRRYRTCFPGKG